MEAPERRVRRGGIGDEDLAPACEFGIPTRWVRPHVEDYTHGRGSERPSAECPKLRAPRADNPPTFESEADFLARHGLLVAGEAERLPADAFEPERVVVEAREDEEA